MPGSNLEHVKIEDLQFGDLISIEWLDASEIRSRLPKHNTHYDTPVCVVGFFCGIRGSRKKHMIIAKEKLPMDSFNADFIPVDLIDNITLIMRGCMQKLWKQTRVLKRFSCVRVKPGFSKRIALVGETFVEVDS